MDWVAKNEAVFRSGLEQFAKREVKPTLKNILTKVATQMVAIIDGEFVEPDGTDQFPVFTNNLHDATGVAVYIDGVTTAYIPTRRASGPQTDDAGNKVWGSFKLQEAIRAASTTFSTGIWIVLFSSVPYAYSVNIDGSPWGRGVNFFESLEDDLVYEIIAYLNLVAASPA